MSVTPEDGNSVIEWAVAGRALPGEEVSGDLYVVATRPDGPLVAVIDGLGHGPEAAKAAQVAASTLADLAHLPIIEIVERCHERLRSTRGVVMSLATFSVQDHMLTWLGVGNVEGVLLRADPAMRPTRELAPLRVGVLGDRMARLHSTTLPVRTGDTLVFATDGLQHDFIYNYNLTDGDSVQRLADRLLARYARDTDDALVLVARYLGMPG